jgi:hypothetical protein
MANPLSSDIRMESLIRFRAKPSQGGRSLRAENAGKGVIALDGRMVERLHLAAAEKLLA